MDVHHLAQGGEAVIYRVEHADMIEIVAKCPLVNQDLSSMELACIFDSIIYET